MEETKYPELPKKEGELELPMKFEAPEKYNSLSKEEKEELTKKMMAAHRKFIREQGILPEKGT